MIKGQNNRFPLQTFEAADRMLVEGSFTAAAMLHELALARGLITTEPMHIPTLWALTVDRNFIRDRHGRIRRLVVDGSSIGNCIPIGVALPQPVADRAERHIKTFRPILLDGARSRVLFLEKPNPLHVSVRELRLIIAAGLVSPTPSCSHSLGHHE